jgi:uncharacterized alkaline shock family protein YloU
MSRDGHIIRGPAGTIRIDGGVLAALVIAAAELVDGARVPRPRRGLDVVVTDGKAHVQLELAATYGTVLPVLGREVQANIAGVLRDSAGLVVEAVDVSIEELDG